MGWSETEQFTDFTANSSHVQDIYLYIHQRDSPSYLDYLNLADGFIAGIFLIQPPAFFL